MNTYRTKTTEERAESDIHILPDHEREKKRLDRTLKSRKDIERERKKKKYPHAENE